MIPRIRNLVTAIAAAILLSIFLPNDPAAAQVKGENRAKADSLNDPRMMEALNTGSDMHAVLSEIAAEKGWVRVLVELESPLKAGASIKDPDTRADARAQIAAAQQALISDLGAEAQVHNLLKNHPMLSLSVTERGLTQLLNAPNVKSVGADLKAQTFMNQSLPIINADDQHNVSPQPIDGTGTAVAILDTGVDTGHEFLSTNIVAEACFSTADPGNGVTSACPNGGPSQIGSGSGEPCSGGGCNHGSHVAGTAAGFNTSLGPGEPVKGVAPGAGIVAVQVFDESGGAASFSDIAAALDHVETLKLNGMNVVAANLSLGTSGFQSDSACEGAAPILASLNTVAGSLMSNGILVVAAAGNEGQTRGISAPACLSNFFSVGAVSENDDVTCYTNESLITDVLAPGGQGGNGCGVPTDTLITSSVPPSNGYLPFQGTSMATPHVVGAVALLKDRYPAASPAQVGTALKNGVPITSPFDRMLTEPRINLNSAMSYLAGQFPKPQPLGALAPNARAGVVSGANVVTAFFSFFNGANGNQPLNDCVVGIPPQVPADFRFRQLNQTTFAVIGGINEPIDLAQNEAETVLLVFDPTAPIDPHMSVPIQFHCSDSPSGNNIPFTNHFTLSANDPQPADVLVSLIEHDDPNSLFITIPGNFATEHVFLNFLNIGTAATLHFTVDDGGMGFGMTGTACLRRFNFPGDTGCAGASQSVTGGNSYTRFVSGGGTLLQLTLTLNSNGAIPQSVFNRLFVRARTGSASGTIRGTNSLAVHTQ